MWYREFNRIPLWKNYDWWEFQFRKWPWDEINIYMNVDWGYTYATFDREAMDNLGKLHTWDIYSREDLLNSIDTKLRSAEILEQNPMVQWVINPNKKYYIVHNSQDWNILDKGKGVFGMDQVDYNVLGWNNVVAMELTPKKVFKGWNQRDVYKRLFGEDIPESTFDFDRYDRKIYDELKKQGYDLLQYTSPMVGRWTENVVLDKSIIWKTKNMWSRSQAIETTKWRKIDKSHI